MAESVKLVVDAMGGDNAPDAVLKGTRLALEADPDLQVYLCGLPDVVNEFASSNDRCVPVPATEIIEMGDHPVDAIRTKKDSSIVKGCELVRSNEAQGFFSAGSTGACLAGATLIMGRVKGVKRPSLGVVIPSYRKPTFLLDVGANADCKPDYLVQFAKMGCLYMEKVLKVDDPTLGLLNIGEEETKGSFLAQESYRLLKDHFQNFKGNCEGGDLTEGNFDVVVTDGFTGNVCLKTIEGTSRLLLKMIKDAITSSAKSKIGALLIKDKVDSLKEKISPDKYGGTPLLGVKGECIIGHGSSNSTAIKNGILAGCDAVRIGLSQLIAESIGSSNNKAVMDGELPSDVEEGSSDPDRGDL